MDQRQPFKLAFLPMNAEFECINWGHKTGHEGRGDLSAPAEEQAEEGRVSASYQHIVLGDGDVVGMHGEPDTLLHLRGESPGLAGPLASLLPCAPA